MNTGSKLLLFILPYLLSFLPVSCYAQSASSDSLVKKTGFVSITAVITYVAESPEKKLRDSLQWQEQDLIIKKYAGKKIKQVLFQRSSGRVIIFLRGSDNVLMDKATAIKEGILKPDPEELAEEKRSFMPLRPIDIFIDSTVYIGIKNVVTINGPDINDLIITHPGTDIRNTGKEDEYMITATNPGTATFIFKDSVTKRTKYLCHARIKRLPADDLATEPEVRLGNIRALYADQDLIKQQTKMIVGNGFSIAGGTVYFTGSGFRDLIVAALDEKLVYVKPYLDLCLPGSQIVFDNVTVRDPAGKVYSVSGFSITVTDSSSLAGTSEDYFAITDFPEFADGKEGLKYYVRQQLTADGNDSENKKAAFTFKVEEDGSLAPISNQELSALSSFERKCFDIIRSGPKWKPGKFKGRNVAMAVTFSADF